jgi:adenine-specific DNA glycosylase
MLSWSFAPRIVVAARSRKHRFSTDSITPQKARFAQAMMDLGSGICNHTRSEVPVGFSIIGLRRRRETRRSIQ